MPLNEFGQPIGAPVNNWAPCLSPSGEDLKGQYGYLTRLIPDHHGEALFDALCQASRPENWTYLPYGPFDNKDTFLDWLKRVSLSTDPLFYTVMDAETDKAVGLTSYLRIDPHKGSIEVGHIHFATIMQKTPLSTEVMFLMMKHVFEDLGYRRYEWKCDDLNTPSKTAALRLGFQFEGIFRQALVYKNRNRDTTWLSVIDSDWPALKTHFENWLQPDNFDSEGMQINRLGNV